MNTQTDVTRLTTYPLPEVKPRSESFHLRMRNFLDISSAFFGGMVGFFAFAFLLTLVLNRPYFSFAYDFEFDVATKVTYCATLIGIIGVLVALSLIIASMKRRLYRSWTYYYEQVPQGRITKLTIKDGKYYVYVEGYNRMNQLRTDLWPVNAKRWSDDVYFVDEYYDFTNEPRD